MPDRPLREAVALAMGWRWIGGDPDIVYQWTDPAGHYGDPPDYPSADYSGVPAMEAWAWARGQLYHQSGSGMPERTEYMCCVTFYPDSKLPRPCVRGKGAHYAEALARAIVEAGDA